jgi:uncharacterized protein with PQ loop repeat
MSLIFFENQNFTKSWMWLLLAVITILMIRFVVKLLKEEKIKKINPLFFVIFLIPLALLFLALSMKLETRFDSSGFSYRYYPLSLTYTKIDWVNVDSVYVCDYHPLAEYGGWGVREGKRGKSYTVSGDKGIQLVYKNKDRVLFGTHEPERAKVILNNLKQANYIRCSISR